jgi:hypothetical protein
VLWIGALLCGFVVLGLRTKSSGSAHRAALVLITLALGFAFLGLGR